MEKENIKKQTTFNKNILEELTKEIIIENNVNKENIEGGEYGN